MYNSNRLRIERKNKAVYTFLKSLAVFAAFLIFMPGCETSRPTVLYSPILPGNIMGMVRTYDNSSVDGAIVFLTTDALLENKVAQQKIKADGKYSFLELKPGYYYISAYIDRKNDGTYTIGEDYLGGKLAGQWDLETSYHPQVLENKDTVIDVGLLAPMPITAIENGTSAVNLNPSFNWPKYDGAAFYRLRVTSRSKSYWIIDTAKNSIVYGVAPETADSLITPPTQLIEDEEYYWSVTAFKSKDLPVAYSDISRFFTVLNRK